MSIAVVLIGRNEGARLVAALESLKTLQAIVIYVDSGSKDASVAMARGAGATVVELSDDKPFTAARGRNAGFDALGGDIPDFVQFIDGDCRVNHDWIATAAAELAKNPEVGIVTGWRSEINRDASVYNAMCDWEWHRPAGEIMTCGGDMMVRSSTFVKVGGFDETVIAAEDDEFCIRVRATGASMRRLPLDMTYHDADMTRFSQWWSRCIRSGHGFAQVGAMHDGYFATERKRVLVYGAIIPAIALVLALVFPTAIGVGLLGIAALYGVSYYRSVRGLMREGLPPKEALHHGIFLVISKFPNLIGMGVFVWRRARGHKMNIIEYK